MPRGKVPSLLSTNNGGIEYGSAKKRSNCNRCKAVFENGTKIGLMKTQKSGFSQKKHICLGCVESIVNQTQQELDVIKTGLSNQ